MLLFRYFNKAKDPMSAYTHFWGMIMTVVAAIPLLNTSYKTGHGSFILSTSIFMLSMFLLYTASTCYHFFNPQGALAVTLKKFDHIMISVLIAGSYTPICCICLPKSIGTLLLVIIWSLATIGILIKVFFVFCPRWVSSVLYIGMGWICIISISSLLKALSPLQFGLLLLGGIFYSVGGVIYSLKASSYNKRHKTFGTHEIFHVFVLLGSLCHILCVFNCLCNPSIHLQ